MIFVEVTESEIERTQSESDGDSAASSPTQYVARELLDTVIKNAVEIVQSGNKQSYILSSKLSLSLNQRKISNHLSESSNQVTRIIRFKLLYFLNVRN